MGQPPGLSHSSVEFGVQDVSNDMAPSSDARSNSPSQKWVLLSAAVVNQYASSAFVAESLKVYLPPLVSIKLWRNCSGTQKLPLPVALSSATAAPETNTEHEPQKGPRYRSC